MPSYVSKEIDPSKSNNSKKFMISYHWLFNHELKFQDSGCNGGYVLAILSVNKRDIGTITVKNIDYHYRIIHNISKSGAIDLLENSVLEIVDKYKKYSISVYSKLFLTFPILLYVKWLIVWRSISL